MLARIRALWRENSAQDLIEYTLLLGFVALAVIGVFIGSGKSLAGIWTSASSTVAAANHTTSAHHHSGDGGDGGGGDGGSGDGGGH